MGSSRIDMGSCGLRVVHGSIKTGHKAANWVVHQILKSLYNLFKQSPVRRADLLKIAPDTKFPLKFCTTRWCENTHVCKRAIDVYDDVKTFVDTAKLDNHYTVKTLKTGFQDALTLPKIMFFASVSSTVEPFLTKFQSPKPMVPFLASELLTLLYALLSRFVKDAVLQKADTYRKVCKIDCSDSNIWCSLEKVDVGVAADAFINRGLQKRKYLKVKDKHFEENVANSYQRWS